MNCPGCINPQTHAPVSSKTRLLTVEELISEIPRDVDGISLSGGEPFEQDLSLLDALVQLGQEYLGSVGIFTGLNFAEILRIRTPGAEYVNDILTRIDWMVVGRYRRELAPGGPLCSSANQRLLLLSDRHTLADFESTTEITFDLDTATAVKTGTLHGS